MLKLRCISQNYAWGKLGTSSLVGKIAKANGAANEPEDKPFAEFWMGDHVNGPSKVLIDENDQNFGALVSNEFLKENAGRELPINALFESDNVKFLGKRYLEAFSEQDPKLKTSLSYLFKVLSVRTALSI